MDTEPDNINQPLIDAFCDLHLKLVIETALLKDLVMSMVLNIPVDKMPADEQRMLKQVMDEQ